MVWLRISPEIDFYLETDLQGVTDRTSEHDVKQYEHVVVEEFVERMKKAFPEEDFRTHSFDFGIARGKMAAKKAA
ncbi:MAG TPA: hypothetical protein VN604_03480 [Nitrospirota bacterium]|nr:hypothetical protein [Nitrospirota bacterium]